MTSKDRELLRNILLNQAIILDSLREKRRFKSHAIDLAIDRTMLLSSEQANTGVRL